MGGADCTSSIQMHGPVNTMNPGSVNSGIFLDCHWKSCTRNIKRDRHGQVEPHGTNTRFRARGTIRKQSNVKEADSVVSNEGLSAARLVLANFARPMPGKQTPGAGIYVVNRALVSYHELTCGCFLICLFFVESWFRWFSTGLGV